MLKNILLSTALISSMAVYPAAAKESAHYDTHKVIAPVIHESAARSLDEKSQGVTIKDKNVNTLSTAEMHVKDKIIFLSGGIGAEEQAMMKHEAHKYNTRMSFARYENGGFITDVQVRLYDNQGNILLSRSSDGPYFYIALPEGKYTLKASYLGDDKSVTLSNTSPNYDSGMMRFTWKDRVKLPTE